MSDARYEWVDDAYRALVSTQSYGGRTRIADVRMVDLPLFSDEGGDFCEISRVTADGTLEAVEGYRPAQCSYSYMEPGTIKAWHLHRYQDDLWFVPPHDRLLVGLLDTRATSPSNGVAMRLTLGAGRARLLYIPRGVAHGVANVSSRPGHVVYFANNVFDAENPDEHRLPHDLVGGDFWSIVPG